MENLAQCFDHAIHGRNEFVKLGVRKVSSSAQALLRLRQAQGEAC
mgnify:CR=1 FL=1